MNDGLVSNDSDSEIWESSAQGVELDSFVRIFSWSESHVGKRKSQYGYRKLNGPSGSFSTAHRRYLVVIGLAPSGPSGSGPAGP